MLDAACRMLAWLDLLVLWGWVFIFSMRGEVYTLLCNALERLLCMYKSARHLGCKMLGVQDSLLRPTALIAVSRVHVSPFDLSAAASLILPRNLE